MPDGTWRPESPATDSALQALQDEVGVQLPDAYLDQLATSNGGEGDLGVDPGWLQLWPAGQVLSSNVECGVAEELPWLFGFGTSGGGDLLAFDTRAGTPYPVVAVPFIPMEEDSVVQVADSFAAFREHIGRPHPDTPEEDWPW